MIVIKIKLIVSSSTIDTFYENRNQICIFYENFVPKVCPIIFVSNSGADNSASRHDSLSLKGSAESGEEND